MNEVSDAEANTYDLISEHQQYRDVSTLKDDDFSK